MTRDAGRYPRRPRPISCGFVPSSPAARAATPAPWPTWPACAVCSRVGPVVSLAHSTRASFLRQLGWHARARGWDGRASALAGADLEAHADALIGLAADALGVGRFAASAAALHRAADRPDGIGAGAAAGAFGVGVRGTGDVARRRRGRRWARAKRCRLGWRARLGSPHPQIGHHPGRGVEQCRRTRVVAPPRRPRPGHLSTIGNGSVALGVGVPAGRHRQRDAFGCTSGGRPRRGCRYSASPRRRVVGPVTGFTPF